MLKFLFNILYNLKGWELVSPAPEMAFKSVMIAAPHTSNWDFIYAIVAMDRLGLNPRFTIKKEFNVFILGKWIRDLGALWIDRSKAKKAGMTSYMASLFNDADDRLTVVVTPEGTRSIVKEWKLGFYYTALKANVPICCAFMDYKKKTTGVGMCFMPTGVIEEDMKIIMEYYKGISGKFPEKFMTDVRYS